MIKDILTSRHAWEYSTKLLVSLSVC